MKDELFNDENDGAIVRKSAETLINLIAAHWPTIRSLADDEEAKDQVKVAAVINFQFGGKMPCAGVEISFAPLKTKDGATVFIDDPNQTKLPIEEDMTVTISTDGVEPVTMKHSQFVKAAKKLGGKNN